MAKILVVDDEPNIREVVGLYLQQEGHAVISAADGCEMLRLYRRDQPDLVVLDLSLPVVDGLEVCRRIRSDRRGYPVGVVMLTARAGEEDRHTGLAAGADEYVVKPFSPWTLTGIVEALLHRTDGASGTFPDTRVTKERVIEADGLRIDPLTRRVTVREESAELTAREFDLLYCLASRPDQTFTSDELAGEVWKQVPAADVTPVSTHVGRIRQKTEDNPARPRYLLTV